MPTPTDLSHNGRTPDEDSLASLGVDVGLGRAFGAPSPTDAEPPAR